VIKRLYSNLLTFSAYFIFAIFLFFSPQIARAEDLSEWESTQSLPIELASHNSLGISNGLFIFGGATGNDTDEVIRSNSEITGTLLGWTTVSSLIDTRYWGVLSSKNNNVYFLGGAKFSGVTTYNSTVYKSVIDELGNLSTWSLQTPLPNSRSLGGSVVVNDRIYYLGGFNGTGSKSEIYYADIDSDGNLGEWTTNSVGIPEATYGFGTVENSGKIYVIGGADQFGHSAKVYMASVEPDGSILSWDTLESLPQALYRSSILKVGNTIFTIGGETGGVVLDKVFYATINSDGTLSSWQESESTLPIPVSAASAAQLGDYIYLTGGWNTGGYLNTVFFSKITDAVKLPVLSFKQTSAPWNDDLYDSANIWASDSAFSRWGCAVTSAAMVFNYHGLEDMIDGSEVDPGSLNTWLKSQPDGYIGDGNTNWIALSRLSKQLSDLNGVDYEALEFGRVVTSNHQVVKDTIDIQNPVILAEPGHFVVGTGYDDSTILINDPFYSRADLSEYSNTFNNVSTFTPSNTDLSYMMFVIPDGVSVKVFDEDNNEIGFLVNEQPLEDPSLEASSSAEPVSIFYVQKPNSGKYRIEVQGDIGNKFDLDLYFYDHDANVRIFNLEDDFSDSMRIYEIDFNKEDSAESAIQEIVTYESLLKDIKQLYVDKKIKIGAYAALTAELKIAQSFKNNQKIEIKLLKTFKKTITSLSKGKQISNDAKIYLLEKADILIKNS